MLVKMKDTVEDSHKCFHFDEDGMPSDMYHDVALFVDGVTYDFSKVPGGDQRAKKLIKMNLGEEVVAAG